MARALEELGRLIKTLYLLRFIDDKAYRRRILVQLNRGEGRHQLARVVFHGKRDGRRRELRETLRERRKTVDSLLNLRRGSQGEPAASTPAKAPNASPEPPVLKRYENE